MVHIFYTCYDYGISLHPHTPALGSKHKYANGSEMVCPSDSHSKEAVF